MIDSRIQLVVVNNRNSAPGYGCGVTRPQSNIANDKAKQNDLGVGEGSYYLN